MNTDKKSSFFYYLIFLINFNINTLYSENLKKKTFKL